MNDLVLCTSCTRHVRRTEERCPFCGMAVAEEARRARPAVAPPGLSRARLYAFHAAVATSVAVGCGGTTAATSDAGNPGDARANDALSSDGQSIVDAAQDAATDGATTGDASDSSTLAESGADTSIHDAGSDGDGWGPPPPPYGCVFPEGCGDVKV
jgi:hypothetical protein